MSVEGWPNTSDSASALYVHLATDGGIFLLEGATGKVSWMLEAQLFAKLETLRAQGGLLLYSRDEPTQHPPEYVTTLFKRIASTGLPIQIVAPHPKASEHSKSSTTILMSAAYVGADPLVSDLTRRKVDPDVRDDSGYTALMYAAKAGKLRASEILIDAGAAVSVSDVQGSTPLMFAAQHGYDDVVRLLLSRDADPDVRESHGYSADDLARLNGHQDTAELIVAQRM